jgi:4,5-DOPA dioxygenase extradiol
VQRQPALFVSHGSPMMALEPSSARDFLAGLGRSLTRPDAIVVVSAHFDRPGVSVTSGVRPETIHDFGGFPEALYRMQYPAPGDPVLAHEIVGLLGANGIEAMLDPSRGLDHGAWVPLTLLYPEADIPVVQVSIDSHRSPAWHRQLGLALAPLRDRNVLILGSGSMTHDLRSFFSLNPAIGAAAPGWVSEFADWMDSRLNSGDTDAVLDAVARGPSGRRNHPTPDHILPLFVAMGAGGSVLHARTLHRSTTYGILAMDAYAFD